MILCLPKGKPLSLFLLSGVLLLAATAQAGGPIHGARAAGMGTAFIGLSDDPSALLHNPAGIVQLTGTQIYGGVTLLSAASEYSSGQSEEDTLNQLYFPTHLYLVSHPPTSRLAFGLAFDSPFGIGGREWDQQGATRYLSTENSIATFAINPNLAIQLTSKLSLAMGLNYLRAEMRSVRMVDQSAVGAADGRARLEAEGDGWGYNLGLLYRGNDLWQIGAAYRSEIDVDFSGNLNLYGIAAPLQPLFGGPAFHTGISSASTFPEIYSIGVAIFPLDKFVIAIDLELVRWSSFDRTETHLAQQVAAAGVSDTTTLLDWDDSLQVKIGGEYSLNGSWKLRAGYAFIQGVVPEHTLGPENPDVDQHNLSIGAGWQKDRITLDGFYNLGLFDNQQVSNSLLSGSYDTEIHYFGISCGYRF